MMKEIGMDQPHKYFHLGKLIVDTPSNHNKAIGAAVKRNNQITIIEKIANKMVLTSTVRIIIALYLKKNHSTKVNLLTKKGIVSSQMLSRRKRLIYQNHHLRLLPVMMYCS